MEYEYNHQRNVESMTRELVTNHGGGTFFLREVVVWGVGSKNQREREREREGGDQNPQKTQKNTHIHTTTTMVGKTVTRKGVPQPDRETQYLINPRARENAGRRSHGPHP